MKTTTETKLVAGQIGEEDWGRNVLGPLVESGSVVDVSNQYNIGYAMYGEGGRAVVKQDDKLFLITVWYGTDGEFSHYSILDFEGKKIGEKD